MPVTGAGIPITTLRMVLIALRACRLSEAVKPPLIIHRTPQIANREIPLNATAFRGMVRRKRGEEREMGGGLGRAVAGVFSLAAHLPLFPPAAPAIPLRTQ